MSGPFKEGSTSRRSSLDWVLSENEGILHVGIFTLIWEVAESGPKRQSVTHVGQDGEGVCLVIFCGLCSILVPMLQHDYRVLISALLCHGHRMALSDVSVE